MSQHFRCLNYRDLVHAMCYLLLVYHHLMNYPMHNLKSYDRLHSLLLRQYRLEIITKFRQLASGKSKAYVITNKMDIHYYMNLFEVEF